MSDTPAPADSLRLSVAARMVGVSAVTLRRWADAGRIECFRTPGGQRRFRRRDLERILGNGGDPGSAAASGAGAPSGVTTRPETEHQRMFASLRRASRAISSSVVLEEVLDTIARATAQALGTSDCIIFSYDRSTDELKARAIFEDDPTGYVIELNDSFPVDQYPGGRELLERGGVLEERVSDPQLDPGSRASMLEYDEKTSLAVGLRFGDEPLGLLVMTETAHERHFTEAERELTVALGEQAAIALHNATMFLRQQEQNARLSSLLESSRAIATTADLGDALGIVAQRAVEGVGAAQCLISEYDETLDAAIPRALFERRPSGWKGLNVPIPLADSIVDHKILRSGRPLVERISDPDLDPMSREAMELWGTKACLTVPLRLGERSTGFLTLWETDDERRFTDGEIALAIGLGEQAAIAIHKAQLIGHLEEQNRRLASLLDVSRAVASSLVPDEVLRRVVEAAIETFVVDSCVVWEYDAARDALVERLAVDVETDYQATGEVWPLSERPSERAIMRGREPVVETISDPDLDPLSRASMDEFGERTCLSVPLWMGDEALGLLVLLATHEERSFSAGELELARGLGEQAAIAIHNAKLFERAQERGEQLAAHAARMDLISESAFDFASTLDLRQVLLSVAERLVAALDTTSCEVFMLSSPNEVTLYASVERGRVLGEWDGAVYALDDWGLSREAVATGRAVTVSDRDDPRLTAVERADMEAFDERGKLVVPLVAGERTIGIVELLETGRVRSFTADEIATVEAVCRTAALAIDNARLFEAQEERNQQLVSLLEVGKALTSTVEIGELLAIVARTATEALEVDECVIFEFDDEADTLTARSFYSLEPSDYDELGESLPLEDYPDDRAILRGDQVVVETLSDPTISQTARESLLKYGEKTCVSVPLRFGEETVGIMALITVREERRFTPPEVELARGLGEQAAAAIHNAQQFARLELRTREAELLNEVARKATASLNVVEVARVTIDEIKRLVRFDRAALLLADNDGVLSAVFASENQPAMLEGLELVTVDADVRSLLGEKRAAVLTLPEDGRLIAGHPSLDDLHTVALVGLARDDVLTGVLVLGNADDKSFSRADRRFMEDLGTHLSLAINNASLFESVKLMHLANLRALSSALNAKDYYTLGHTTRVAAYAVLLAKELGWSQELIEQVEEIAYLHDIGKIAVSDRSLLKPGPLSDEEWELMRQHPVISAEIIEPLLGEHLVAGVRHHHEYYDGTGYPDGLSGEGISPMARLLCVVDSYDAMSSLRLYRQARTYRECLAELETGKGKQFDPHMVDVFRCVLEDLLEMKREALVAAWEAATEIDGAVHTLLADPQTTSDDEYTRVTALLEVSARPCASIAAMATEVRIDEHRSMIVTVSSDDPQRVQRRGEILLSDQEQMEAYAGRPMDTNVLYVDDQGAWVCGLAPIFGDGGEILGLVRSEVPATDVTGPLGVGSSVRQTFAGLARDAASRLMRVEIDSMIDGLSGLYNHRYLHERLSEEVARAQAEGTQLTVLFCDVDNFKDINDRLGHRVGDDLLRRMSHAIGKAIRRVDLAARYGGDEFAVILIDSGADMGQEVAERIRSSIAAMPAPSGAEAPTVSIGVATLPGDATTKTELLDKADWAMYLAKRRGRNCVVRFSEEKE